MLYFFFTIVVLILLANTAREAGRNIWLWATIGAVIWIGVYLLIPPISLGVYGFGRSNFGWAETDETTIAIVASIANWIISLSAIFGLNKFLGKNIVREADTVENNSGVE